MTSSVGARYCASMFALDAAPGETIVGRPSAVLRTRLFDGDLPNPVFIGSGPLSSSPANQLVMDGAGGLVSSVELVGTPDEAADNGRGPGRGRWRRIFDHDALLRLSRRFIVEVTEGWGPAALQ
jgi:hypothetical protein